MEGHFCGAFFCADDSLSCITSIAELIAVSYIYDFFKNENDVEFAFAKTILNKIRDLFKVKLYKIRN